MHGADLFSGQLHAFLVHAVVCDIKNSIRTEDTGQKATKSFRGTEKVRYL